MNTTRFDTLKIRETDGVAFVTIDHPPLNLLDAPLMLDLDRLCAVMESRAEVRVIVFASADPDFFIPHGDMGFVDHPEGFATLDVGRGQSEELNPMQRLFERVRQLPQVTIGKLAGLARGGGSEFLQSLDMRFAARGKAGLAQMEAPTGIVPGGGATAHLPRLMGRARALEAILGAGLFDADTAAGYGWINRALDPGQLDPFVDDLAHRIASLAPGVAKAAKTAVDAASGTLADALRVENEQLAATFAAPAAGQLTRLALKRGAQTREVERHLETMLRDLHKD